MKRLVNCSAKHTSDTLSELTGDNHNLVLDPIEVLIGNSEASHFRKVIRGIRRTLGYKC